MEDTSLVVVPLPAAPSLEVLGQQANQAGRETLFHEYHRRLAENTKARKLDDLTVFAWYILEAEAVRRGGPSGWTAPPEQARLRALEFYEQPVAWRGLTWGLVSAFVQWQLRKGYAIGTINLHLSTVKRYAELAYQAEMITPQEFGAIRAVHVLSHREGVRLDEERQRAPVPLPTRIGAKKAEPKRLSSEQAEALKRLRENSPIGRRNTLLMCLLLDHGLRVSEVQLLDVECFDLEAGRLRLKRPKVDMVQTHTLTTATLAAAKRYIAADQPSGFLFPGRWMEKKKAPDRITLRAIKYWVRDLGKALKPPITSLSPHDCRHFWADSAGRGTNNTKRLQQAGGWKSEAMAIRYQRNAAIANEGIVLGEVAAEENPLPGDVER